MSTPTLKTAGVSIENNNDNIYSKITLHLKRNEHMNVIAGINYLCSSPEVAELINSF